MQSKLTEQIKKDFKEFDKEVLAILLYGSQINGKSTPRSDIDICIVSGSMKKAKEIYKETLYIQSRNPKYDIHVFELLPLYLKNEIIHHYEIIFTKSSPELSYYFYLYRKLWEDQSINRINL